MLKEDKPKHLNEFFNNKEEFEELLLSIKVKDIKEEWCKKWFKKFRKWYKEYGWEIMEVYTNQINQLKNMKEL